MRETWAYYLRGLAMDIGIKKSHTNYQKFILLGRSRTGSNYLRGLLNSHSQVIVFGELLKNDQNIEWGMDGYPSQGRALQIMRTQPVQFMEKFVFGKHPPHIQAVGFKLFYYHAQQNLLQPVWEYLHRTIEIRVLHIKRRNILRTHLSRQRAELTDRWANVNGSMEKEEPITLSYEKCLQDFVQTRKWEEEFDAYFADHPKRDVVYEDLIADPNRELAEIQDFLGLRFEPLQPGTYKQSVRPLSQAIANFSELKEQFANTPWASFFQENE
jgi:LPS sulfotransferase NodH